ncbi:hypothetical protein [Nocardia sp. NPDC050793]|uniref:hypothetical protein n=1 Tax=Nocardia sp. NPDC050793 TaxID=3155159 RepID=UPI0033C2374F
MRFSSAEAEYIPALLFAVELADSVAVPAHDIHGHSLLREPLDSVLSSVDWGWCDNKQGVDLVARRPLRAVVVYLAQRSAVGLPLPARPASDWEPEADTRLRGLSNALEFAATCAEEVWSSPLSTPLEQWLRSTLSTMLRPLRKDESTSELDYRVREAVSRCYRYCEMRYELFVGSPGQQTGTRRHLNWSPTRCTSVR